MNILEQDYARVMALAGRDSVLSDPAMDFYCICRLAGADPEAMDRLVVSELGPSGEDLVSLLRKRYFDSLGKK